MKKSDKGIADQAHDMSNTTQPPLHIGSGDDTLNSTRSESELVHEEQTDNSLPHTQEEQQVFEGVPDTPYARKDRNNVHGNPVPRDRHSIADTLPAVDFDYTK